MFDWGLSLLKMAPAAVNFSVKITKFVYSELVKNLCIFYPKMDTAGAIFSKGRPKSNIYLCI